MGWRWTAWRWILSTFVAFHLSALILWTLPDCAIKTAFIAPYRYYVLPAGVWQWWAIFAPDPVKNALCLDVEVIDSRGLRHLYQFPRMSEMSQWQKTLHYRLPKFVANMSNPEYVKARELVVKHAVRSLDLAADAFPVTATIYYEVRDTPPLGVGEADPMADSKTSVIDRYQFESPKEVGQ